MNDSQYIRSVIKTAAKAPDTPQTVGSVTVEWWEDTHGKAMVVSSGGSAAERVLAENFVFAKLAKIGYSRAGFHLADVDPREILDREQTDLEDQDRRRKYDVDNRELIVERQKRRNEVIAKAERLVQNGSVSMIRNGNEYVVAVVRGEGSGDNPPGTPYEVEIHRQEPNSSFVTGWFCSCPWGTTWSRNRTRQYKQHEDLPCSHAIATYFMSRISPTEEEQEPAPPGGGPVGPVGTPIGEPSPFAVPPAGQQGPGLPGGAVPAVPRGPRGIEQLTPMKPEDIGAISPDEILEQRLGPFAPKRQELQKPELTPEEERFRGLRPPERIQRPPMERLKDMQRQEQPFTRPGEAPYGQPAPPGTVSVPGARGPSERNPWGGYQAWSSVYNGHRIAATPGWYVYQSGDTITLAESVFGITEGPSNAEGLNEYQEIPAGSVGEVYDQDPRTGWVEAIFPLSGGAKTPTHVRCFLEPRQITEPKGEGLERRDPDKKQRPFSPPKD